MMKGSYVFGVVIAVMLGVFLSCETAQVPAGGSAYRFPEYKGTVSAGSWNRSIVITYTVDGVQESVPVQIYFPRSYRRGRNMRTLIGLHDLNGSMSSWSRFTRIEDYAERHNYILVCPNMPGTLYETKYFPETTRKWNRIPGGRWIAEILVPYLRQSFGIALDKNKTGIFGCSTGARGAVLVASAYPELFGAAAGFSGAYDSLAAADSRLLWSVYGEYKKFKKRWKDEDNVIRLAENLKDIPLILAHGKDDTTVPYDQTRLLAIRLLQLRGKCSDKSGQETTEEGGRRPYEFHMLLRRNEYHNWAFWRTMPRYMMPLFDRYLEAD
ncbi:MAG TPA: alpha/beta hydrolase-fold protein [Spirochaetota bacterium]|nr:alpha/beta hydrolase-fold protein [Spirochaetota bacterium]HPQ52624.1 alpha/beta hydrolase-fold protein [Spirochaetota bacterium]